MDKPQKTLRAKSESMKKYGSPKRSPFRDFLPPYKNMGARLGDTISSSIALGSLYCHNITKTQEM